MIYSFKKSQAMNIKRNLTISGLALLAYISAGAQFVNPVTEAVLRNYAEILAENPKDYFTLYDRAQQYFDMGEFDRALSDIEMAIEYTPDKDKDYRLAEYSLKGEILSAQKKYEDAISAINTALSINPVSQSDLYKLGNLNILVNRPDAALKAFEALQRENPRSQEAFYGMAKANAMLGNKEKVEDLIKEIEILGKQSYITYCRIGDLYSDMGNIKEATTNYAIAYSMEDENLRPVASLKLLVKKNPDLVMTTIDGIIASKPDNLAMNYLQAILAFEDGQYSRAEKATKDLAGGVEKESSAIYRMMAMSQHFQNKNDEAKESIMKAESISPNELGVLLDKSEILLTISPDQSYEAAIKAVNISPNSEASLLAAAKSSIMTGRYAEALDFLNNVILSNPANAEAILLRGYLNTEYLNDGKAGVTDYTRAGNLKTSEKVRDLALKALAKSKINKKLDADGLIKEAIEKSNNKEDYYFIAVYFAQTGNLEKAKEYADKALSNGYSNLYNIKTDAQPLFNLRPIQHLN